MIELIITVWIGGQMLAVMPERPRFEEDRDCLALGKRIARALTAKAKREKFPGFQKYSVHVDCTAAEDGTDDGFGPQPDDSFRRLISITKG